MTFAGGALIPAAPVLVPGLSGRTIAAVEAQRAAVRALQRLADRGAERIVVAAESAVPGEFDAGSPWSLERLGVLSPRSAAPSLPNSSAPALPVPLAVGAALLQLAGWTGAVTYRALTPATASATAAHEGRVIVDGDTRVGLVVMGNGSARCTDKAPGAFHPDAAAFNAALLAMVHAADLPAILALSPASATGQLSDARVPLQTLAGAAAGTDVTTDVDHADVFGGVFYLCATVLPSHSS